MKAPLNTDSVDVRDVVSSETSLKIIRNDFLEQCPFCGSGTGPKGTSAFSFYQNGYKCFSCDQTGDSVKFIERYYRLSIAEAIQYFKSRYLGQGDDFAKLSGNNGKWAKKAKDDTFDTMGEWVIHLYENNYESDNLTSYLLGSGIFDEKNVRNVLLAYQVRTSSGGCIFPYIDKDNRLRTLKMIKYEKGTGKRDKSTFPFYLHKQMMGEEFKYKRCFFGEHLLSLSDKVGIVESEKTAIVASIAFPEMVFLATGGKNVLSVSDIKQIKSLYSKEITLFPDHDSPDKKGLTAYEQWSFIATELKNNGFQITVDDTLEGNGYPYGSDIADLILDNFSDKKKPVQKSAVEKRIEKLESFKEELGSLHIPDEPIILDFSVILEPGTFLDRLISDIEKNIKSEKADTFLQKLERFIMTVGAMKY